MYRTSLFFLSLLAISTPNVASPEKQVQFALAWESQQLTNGPAHLLILADINGNGREELIVTDFSNFLEGQGKGGSTHNFLVVEWDDGEFKIRWKRQWYDSPSPGMRPVSRQERSRRANLIGGVVQLTFWNVGDTRFVEAIPPYYALEWSDGHYVWHEQARQDKGTMAGSWVFDWVDPTCSFGNIASYPRECFIAIRDFEGNGKPVLISVWQDGITETFKPIRRKGKRTQQILRVRRYAPGFPVLWEAEVDRHLLPLRGSQARYDPQVSEDLLFYVWLDEQRTDIGFLAFGLDPNGHEYRLRPMDIDARNSQFSGRFFFNDPIYGRTRDKAKGEYWGYHAEDDADGEPISLLRKMYFSAEGADLVVEDVSFQAHANFIGVASFALGNMDGDELDEIVLIEHTGKRKRPVPTGDYMEHWDVANYIHVLKWSGEKYESIWTSPPFEDQAAKLWIGDLLGTGDKQIIVGTGKGTLQVWEKR